jgi:hypothetical protein
MPSLVKAVVKIIEDTLDSCFYYNYCHCEFCDNSHSIGDGTGSNNSVLLKGLSEAKDLALTSETKIILCHSTIGGEVFFLFAFLVTNRSKSNHGGFIFFSCALSSLFSRTIRYLP